ncbi:hypothetical protein DLJ47_24140 [Micromonospora sp. S4605]|nr:hypothetical protein DLJ47_24140 [Micromonospora sp. S4605]
MTLWAMLGTILMAGTLPDAFSDHALAFAGAYVTVQVGRGIFLVAALRGRTARLHAGGRLTLATQQPRSAVNLTLPCVGRWSVGSGWRGWCLQGATGGLSGVREGDAEQYGGGGGGGDQWWAEGQRKREQEQHDDADEAA